MKANGFPLELPRLSSMSEKGLVLDIYDISDDGLTLRTRNDEWYQVPSGLLQWAKVVQSTQLEPPLGPIEFGILPNGSPYAEFLTSSEDYIDVNPNHIDIDDFGVGTMAMLENKHMGQHEKMLLLRNLTGVLNEPTSYINNRLRMDNLYCLEIEADHEKFWKLGIAFNVGQRVSTIKQSMKKGGYSLVKVKVLDVQTIRGRSATKKVEESFDTTFAKIKYYPRKRFNGHTECFKKNPMTWRGDAYAKMTSVLFD